jgi:hypothetical protein
MKKVTKADLERMQIGTTDHPDAAATGSGYMAATEAEQQPVEAGRGSNPADAWTGQYPSEPSRPSAPVSGAAEKGSA